MFGVRGVGLISAAEVGNDIISNIVNDNIIVDRVVASLFFLIVVSSPYYFLLI
jgi:hypothetical protein